jgi:chromosome segregation ATPase
LENFQNKLPDLPKKSLSVDSNVEQKMAAVNKEFVDLVDKCKRMKTTVREVDNKLRTFQQVEKELTDSVVSMEQDKTGDSQLLKAQLVARSQDLQTLTKCHADLANLISARPDEVQCDVTSLGLTVQGLGERLEALEERCVARQREQTLATKPEHQLDMLVEWVAGHESQLYELQPVSLADTTLAEQHNAHRLLMADLDSRRDTINDVTSQCEAQFPDKTADLLDRYTHNDCCIA